MASSAVLTADAFYACIMHALSTEAYEVMGLLVGEVDQDAKVVSISVILPLRRMDKRKDRVEPQPEQLSEAAEKAEALSASTGKNLRVVGWYHSHPHITWMPSHVDVRTQGMMQMLDECFLGLIFSCFQGRTTGTPTDDDKSQLPDGGQIQMNCFQSKGSAGNYTASYIPLYVETARIPSKAVAEQLVAIPEILLAEEKDSLEKALLEPVDIFSKISNLSVYTQALCSVLDVFAIPMLQCLADGTSSYEDRIARLKSERTQLKKRLAELVSADSADSDTCEV